MVMPTEGSPDLPVASECGRRAGCPCAAEQRSGGVVETAGVSTQTLLAANGPGGSRRGDPNSHRPMRSIQ